MKKDLQPKQRSLLASARKEAKGKLVKLLELSQELETVYKTYPELQAVVGHQAWQSLTDQVYRQLLDFNLDPSNKRQQAAIQLNMERLEDISASSLVRDDAGLRDTLSRVLMFRIANNLATNERHN